MTLLFWPPRAWIIAALCALLSISAFSAVRDVAAVNIKQAVQPAKLSVVLFTSPDSGCGYCAGQSQMFDDFAKTYKGNAQLLRVQWTPWRATPPESAAYELYGVPHWVVVKSGRVVSKSTGRLADVQAVQALLDRASLPEAQIAAIKKASTPENAASPTATEISAAATPLSGTERSTLSIFARFDLIKSALDACSNAFPARKDSDAKRIAAWEEKNNAVLQQGARLMLKRSSREDAAVMSEITRTEVKKLQEKAPMAQATQDGCDKVAAELS